MTVEHAVKMPGHKKFHRLQPHALVGTLSCGAGFHATSTRDTRWLPVGDVLGSQQCKACWKKADV